MAVSIVAIIKVMDGQQAGFEEAALRLVEAVNADEPGCLLYTLNRGEDPLTFVIMERYADEDALTAHRGSDHFEVIGNRATHYGLFDCSKAPPPSDGKSSSAGGPCC